MLTDTSVGLEKNIKIKSKYPSKLKIQKVKYSKDQLLSSKELLWSQAERLGVEAVGISSKKNKVNVYISEESLKQDVTAGHCLNGTWYDKSDGTTAIGTMYNANDNGTTSYDAGYIIYVSGVTPSVFLNGNTLTIGTTDYSGAYREEGPQERFAMSHIQLSLI